MVLTEKLRHKLLQRLRSAFDTEGDLKFVVQEVFGDKTGFNFQGTIREMWTGIVQQLENTPIADDLDNPTETENKPALEKLLHCIVYEVPRTKNDKTFKEILDYLKSGYTPKLPSLAKALSEKRCVLFLGPNMLQVSQGTGKASVSFNELVASRIVNEFNREDIYYDRSQSGWGGRVLADSRSLSF